VLGYCAVAGHLGRPTFGLQSVGLAGEERPLDRIEAMAARYAEAIAAVHPTGPVLVAGWSLGAHVALELARVLLARGRAPALVALIDADPTIPDPASLPAPGDVVPWLAEIAAYVERTTGATLGLSVDDLARSPDPAPRLLDALRTARVPQALGGAPAAGAARLTQLAAVFEANSRALSRYRPTPVAAQLTVLQCAGSTFEAGWAALSDRPVATVTIPGDHYTLVAEPNAAVLARKLDAAAVAALQELS
ncbi:MAG: alpha/beta fold hydrolase, partial [Myxococcota bacterium]